MTPKCLTFFNKKRWKSGTLWEHLPKRYHLCTIVKRKSGTLWDETLWGHGLYMKIFFLTEKNDKDSILDNFDRNI